MASTHPLRALAAATLALATAALAPGAARADSPYVVIHDDGSVAAARSSNFSTVQTAISYLFDQYQASGAPIPDVLSVWTTFSFNRNNIETRFLPIGNNVTGIGLERAYAGGPAAPDGTFASSLPPLRAVLIHNNVMALHQRAMAQRLPEEGFAPYLFLLELSHVWGPEIFVPGDTPRALLGADFHWSFWMDAGGSPAGGNVWRDNGDGTFTADPVSLTTLRYSMLDLYLQGLADPTEVPPFAVLTDAMPPAEATDPFTGTTVSAAAFPWEGPGPLTVHATRRTLTIDDVIAANGTRSPTRAATSTTLRVGIVLVVGANDTDDAVIRARTTFDPIAAAMAPAYHRATHERGTLSVVTSSEPTPVPPSDDASGADASAPAGDAQADASPTADASAPDAGTAPTMHGGCAVSHPGHSRGTALALLGAVAAAMVGLRRRRGPHPTVR